MVISGIAEQAEALARDLHAGQSYHGTEGDYRRDFADFHLAPGAEAVRLAGGTELERAIFWLHDSVEDTAITLEGLRDRGMPEDVVDGVDHMTWWRERGQTYEAHLGRLAASPEYGWLKVVDSGHGNLAATLELRQHMDPEEYDICVRHYAGNVLVLGPQVLESSPGAAWRGLVETEMDKARSILDAHRGRTAASLATMLPRPAFAS